LKIIPRVVLLSCVLLTPLAYGADPPTDEVVVEATRANLTRLGEQVLMAERKVYDEYNKLNIKRDYAINCAKQNNYNSRFTKTICQPVFQSKAEENEYRSFMLSLSGTMGGAQGGAGMANALIESAKPGYQKNMIEIARKSPEMQQLLQEHSKLVQQYNAMYYKLNGDPK
jgi:hypothetical protein